jgi:DNA-directed RNA polymerase
MRGAIRSGEAKPALDGVNTLQGVAWTVNTRILDILTECAAHGIKVEGLPQWHDLPIPAKLPDVVWAGMDEDRQRFVRMRKAELHQLNRAAKCDRILFEEDMKIARDMAVQEQFYTPMNCDWRGASTASPISTSSVRTGCVRCSCSRTGLRLARTGLYWLKVHVANCGDFGKISKRPMDERVNG